MKEKLPQNPEQDPQWEELVQSMMERIEKTIKDVDENGHAFLEGGNVPRKGQTVREFAEELAKAYLENNKKSK